MVQLAIHAHDGEDLHAIERHRQTQLNRLFRTELCGVTLPHRRPVRQAGRRAHAATSWVDWSFGVGQAAASTAASWPTVEAPAGPSDVA
jgi:hypothetical protein